MKKSLAIFLFASSLVAQVQIGKNVQIGAGNTATGTILQTNGTNNSSQTTLNFVNPSTYNGLTFTFSNPTLGNETFTVGGTLGNAGLTNSSTTVNGQTCTLGSTCTISASGSSVGTAGQLQMVGSTAGSFAASSVTDNGTTVTSSKPVVVNDGTGKAGAFGLLAGTAPSAAPANTVQINAPTAVTAYSVVLPGTQGTGALTNNGSGVLTWATPGACATCVTSAASLAANQLVLGAGSQASATLGSLGTTTTVLHGNAAGAPTFGAVSLTADVSGTLPAANTAAALSSTTSVNGTTIPASSTLPVTIASGTSALGTSAIASATCATVVTTTATGTASTDAIIWNPNASIKAVTGYVPATAGGLTIAGYPTTNSVNWDVCNWTSASITPGAVTLNWRVVR